MTPSELQRYATIIMSDASHLLRLPNDAEDVIKTCEDILTYTYKILMSYGEDK